MTRLVIQTRYKRNQKIQIVIKLQNISWYVEKCLRKDIEKKKAADKKEKKLFRYFLFPVFFLFSFSFSFSSTSFFFSTEVIMACIYEWTVVPLLLILNIHQLGKLAVTTKQKKKAKQKTNKYTKKTTTKKQKTKTTKKKKTTKRKKNRNKKNKTKTITTFKKIFWNK